ncbi:MAG TPA: hypothetical protein VGX37_08750, partial [Allosphingosinicella sp.]|nr:hypothetical protein [Allosphingosinicella sp.]
MKESAAPWWERRWTLAALIVLSAVPLLWPDVPPLTDLPGHLGRYKIALDLHRSPALQQFYDFHWSLIPNLGVDLLMVPLGRLFGIEAGARIVVILIPPLTFAGFLWAMKEAHRRLTPAYLFAAPLIYSYTFLYGFLNFSLAVAFAFLAFALWLRLGRLERFRLRALLFVPISLLLWVTHVFGWGMLGLMAFAAEAVREYGRRGSVWRAGAAAAWHCLPLAAPLPLMIGGRAPASAGDWFNVKWKVAA